MSDYQRIEKAIHYILENQDRQPSLEDIAAAINLSPFHCLLYTSPSPRDQRGSRMPSSA